MLKEPHIVADTKIITDIEDKSKIFIRKEVKQYSAYGNSTIYVEAEVEDPILKEKLISFIDEKLDKPLSEIMKEYK